MAKIRNIKATSAARSYETVEGTHVSTDSAFIISKPKGRNKGKLRLKAPVPPEQVRAEVTDDLDRGKHRLALDKAKCYHRTVGSADSQEILLFAYHGRISHMLDEGMAFEAEQLLAVVEGKFPDQRQYYDSLRPRLALENGHTDTVLAGLPGAERAQAEQINLLIKQHCKDLSQIAHSQVLSPDHPLRRAARAGHEAFVKVTTGPVGEEDIFLPEISRRSPLLGWKLLIRAIAYYYQGEDEKSLEHLDRIDASAAVHALGNVVRGLMEGQSDADLSTAARRLIGQVRDEDHRLHEALTALDEMLDQGHRKQIPKAITHALAVCNQYRRQFKVRLMQHISVRAMVCDIPPEPVLRGFGNEMVVREAYFWRLFANGLENDQNALYACAAWEEFRRHALNENWFTANSKEEAAVYLHMIDTIKRIPPEFLETEQVDFEDDFPGFAPMYKRQPDWVMRAAPTPKQQRDYFYIYPEKLFERALAACPSRELFTKWLAHVKEVTRDYRQAEAVAQHWHETFPNDLEPLLVLAESADKRGAFNKALKFLDAAEALDSINPAVRSLRRRLLISKTTRHLRSKRSHLVQKDLRELEGAGALTQGDRPAVLAALRYFLQRLSNDTEAEEKTYAHMAEILDSDVAADLLLSCLALHHGLYRFNTDKKIASKLKTVQDPVTVVARICQLGLDTNFQVEIPPAWITLLTKQLKQKKGKVDAQQLKALAEVTSGNDLAKFSFAVSGAGLALGGKCTAEFLIFRAGALQYLDESRAENCLKAAVELARRQGDVAVAERAIDALDRVLSYLGYAPQELTCDDVFVQRVIDEEVKAKKLPRRKRGLPSNRLSRILDDVDVEFADDDECQCPACRRARRQARAANKRPKKRRRPAPQKVKDTFPDDEPLLFDNMEDYRIDDPDDAPDVDEDRFSPPAEVDLDSLPDIQVMQELFDFTGGRPPNEADLERLARENPELAMKLLAIMAGMDDELENDDWDDDIDFGGPLPFDRPKMNRDKRRKKRKQERKNRKRRR